MRIAWLMPNLHVTGGARAAVEIASRMVERGHQFSIVIPAGRKRMSVPSNVDVIECGVSVLSPMLAVPAAMMSMKGHVPYVDVVIGSMPPYALLAHAIGSERNIPSVNYVMSDDVRLFDDRNHINNRLILSVYRAVARRSLSKREIVANSHWTAVKCVSQGGVKPRSIVPAGYDERAFAPKNYVIEIHSPIRLVTVARSSKAKGFSDVVSGLNLAHNRGYEFELKVISQERLDLSTADFTVHLDKPGNDAKLAEAYRWGDIFVFASWSEGFGLPPLEARACGLAVVSTDCGGVREYLKDEVNCLLVPPRDPVEFSYAVTRMIDDKQLRSRLVSQGNVSCREFTWDKVTDKFESVLTELVG